MINTRQVKEIQPQKKKKMLRGCNRCKDCTMKQPQDPLAYLRFSFLKDLLLVRERCVSPRH